MEFRESGTLIGPIAERHFKSADPPSVWAICSHSEFAPAVNGPAEPVSAPLLQVDCHLSLVCVASQAALVTPSPPPLAPSLPATGADEGPVVEPDDKPDGTGQVVVTALDSDLYRASATASEDRAKDSEASQNPAQAAANPDRMQH